MWSGGPQHGTGSDGQSVSQRLDSWKEIAAYLKRDVRTVQRWEKNEGLPVLRHSHQKLDSVYAFKADLDAWWLERCRSQNHESEPQQSTAPGSDPGKSQQSVPSTSPSSETGAIACLRTHIVRRRRGVIGFASVVLLLGVAVPPLLPLIARSYNNRGWKLQQQGELAAALGHYRFALRLSPGYAAAHYNLGDAYEEIPDYDRAQEEYQRAINADLKFYEAYNNLSRLYILRRRDYGAALRLLDRAFSLKPQEPSVRYSLYKNYGWANFQLGNLIQAEQDLRRAVATDDRRGAAHCLLAKVLNAQGRTSAAADAEWESCAAFSSQSEVEPEWRNEAQEHFRTQAAR